MLLEKPGRRDGQIVGRSPYLQAVHLDAPGDRTGSILDVVVTGAGPNSLAGRLAA